jgi:uncharacterized protein YfaT (DUF1175 family)
MQFTDSALIKNEIRGYFIRLGKEQEEQEDHLRWPHHQDHEEFVQCAKTPPTSL